MKSLAGLSKYLGCYDYWKSIRERYQLKWSNSDSLQVFNQYFNGDSNFSSMLKWLKDTVTTLPSNYGNMLIYNTLTGLRPDEACKSISLVHRDLANYAKRNEVTILEHYKYPEYFIRRTKNAYISIITEPILNLAKEAKPIGYNALRLRLKRKGLEMHMAYCRKIFATYLRTSGIEQETIDLLQGRIAKTVFARHYFRPDFSSSRIVPVLESLREKLIFGMDH